jgi:hypothetical protein
MADNNNPTHILYHHVQSICSIMVRYSYALRGTPETADQQIRIHEQQIDVMGGNEQLSEHYLCKINKHGEVSATQGVLLQ